MKADSLFRIHLACLCAAAAASAPRGLAQGYVVFNNRIPGHLVAPIFGGEPGNSTLSLQGNPTNGLPMGVTIYHGPLLEGTGFTAQLWAGPAGTPENQLTAVATTTFLTGSGAGFVQPVTVVIPSVPASGLATLQWRVWKNVGGTVTSWPQVLAGGSIPRGISSAFTSAPLGSSPATAPVTPGLRSFNIMCLSCGTQPAIVLLTPPVVNGVPGETVIVSFNAGGELPVTYRWLYNDAPLPVLPSVSQTAS